MHEPVIPDAQRFAKLAGRGFLVVTLVDTTGICSMKDVVVCVWEGVSDENAIIDSGVPLKLRITKHSFWLEGCTLFACQQRVQPEEGCGLEAHGHDA